MASSGCRLYYVLHYMEGKLDGTLLSRRPASYSDRCNEKHFHGKTGSGNDSERWIKVKSDKRKKEKRDNGVRSLHGTISVYGLT